MKKKLYYGYLIVYFIEFIIELVLYLRFNSTKFGLLYMLINLVIIFLLSFSLYNYSEINLKIRLSKNVMFVILLLLSIGLSLFNYNDESRMFIESIRTYIYIVKPSLILILILLSVYDYKVKGNILD